MTLALRSREAVDLAVRHGWNGEAPEGAWLAWGKVPLMWLGSYSEPRLRFVEALAAQGVRCTTNDAAAFITSARGVSAPLVKILVEMGLDLAATPTWPSEGPAGFVQHALQRFSLEAVQALHAAGAPLPESLVVEDRWPDAQAKRAWYAERGGVAKGRALRELLTLDDVSVAELGKALALDAGLFGVSLGSPEARR